MTHRKAIGILGGTFDPVHYGHLVAAQYAAYGFNLDRVIFMPAAHPPHKNAADVLEAKHRLAMLQLAIADNPVFEMSTLEIDRSGVSYTIDTIESMRRAYTDADLFFIMGMDSLYILDTWKDVQRLVTLCRFIVVTRPNYHLDRNDPALQGFRRNSGLRLIFWRYQPWIFPPVICGLGCSRANLSAICCLRQ